MAASLSDTEIDQAIDAYLAHHWDEVLADIETLVRIPSFRSAPDPAHPDAPFGPGPRAALTAALGIAQRMGFDTRDMDGYIGYAQTPADTAQNGRQIGIIGHVDVVPAGPGWTVEPYAVTRKAGFLLGRGVIDDKGPLMVALHACKLWKDLAESNPAAALPYTVRILFGAAEETGMEDVRYYRERFEDPDFLFTPDAEFPVCYGEKGHYDAVFESPVFENGALVDFQGGTAPNAVPGSAFALLSGQDIHTLPRADHIRVQEAENGLVRIEAEGICKHASIPEGGINAIGLIVDYLLEAGGCSSQEREFLRLEQRLLNCTDGSGFACACADDDFGALTMVGGTIAFENKRLIQSIDVRFPTTISADQLDAKLQAAAQQAGAQARRISVQDTFLLDRNSPEIQTLLSAYNQATGENAQPFTMGGGTYARMFSNAASFGPEKPWESQPAWVGGMHGADEGVSETLLQQAFRIYAKALACL